MRFLGLVWKLLRYRVAVMLILFMLLAVALHQALHSHPWHIVWAGLALAFSYISATSSNDLADQKIDSINHPTSPGRPLITGGAKQSDMWLIFGVASVASCTACLFINWTALLIIFISLLINVLYSLPPIRLSYRTFLAPFALGIAYVGVPYSLGLAAIAQNVSRGDIRWMLGLYIMFVGRIILKDFRDRKGDAKYHKPTFLLRFGKNATCLFSLIGLVVGGFIIILQTKQVPWLAGVSAVYLVTIATMLRRLQRSPVGLAEQLSIGVGAKMGNGLLITLLCYFILQETTASIHARMIIVLSLVAVFLANYLNFIRNPEAAKIGYKG